MIAQASLQPKKRLNMCRFRLTQAYIRSATQITPGNHNTSAMGTSIGMRMPINLNARAPRNTAPSRGTQWMASNKSSRVKPGASFSVAGSDTGDSRATSHQSSQVNIRIWKVHIQHSSS